MSYLFFPKNGQSQDTIFFLGTRYQKKKKKLCQSFFFQIKAIHQGWMYCLGVISIFSQKWSVPGHYFFIFFFGVPDTKKKIMSIFFCPLEGIIPSGYLKLKLYNKDGGFCLSVISTLFRKKKWPVSEHLTLFIFLQNAMYSLWIRT